MTTAWTPPNQSTLAVVALPGPARAQSGSAGGSIGNDEKSLSGSRETPRAAKPSKPVRRTKPETEAPSRASRKSGGGGNGGGNFDGAWVLTSVGSPCGTSSDTVVITGSRMVGQYGTAQVSPNGATSGIGAAGSLTWSMSGRFSNDQFPVTVQPVGIVSTCPLIANADVNAVSSQRLIPAVRSEWFCSVNRVVFSVH